MTECVRKEPCFNTNTVGVIAMGDENQNTEEVVEETESTENTEREVELQGIKNNSENDKFYPSSPCSLHGRRQIFTNEEEITSGNLLKVLNEAISVHNRNRSAEDYLMKYLRGIQPILNRVKQHNSEINNKIVVNVANQIVTFKASEFAGEPIQYVSRGAKKSVPEKIEKLNSMMISEGKQTKDFDLAYKMFTVGVGYRLVLRDKALDVSRAVETGEYLDEAPFEIYIPDPRNTFVIRLNDVSKRVVAGVTYVFLDEQKTRVQYTVYTKNVTYTVEGSTERADKITKRDVHNFGMVTLVEYPCNTVFMSPIEVVHDMLNAYSLVMSDRLDGIEQFIQAIMVFEGVDVTREQFLELKDLGAIKIPPSIDGRQSRVYYLNEQLDQSQTQTLVDDIYQTILQIVGMPSQGNANTSDSSNNGAMIIKNGWWNAEARALETENAWKLAETEFLKIVLKICEESNALSGLSVSDVEPKFGRRSYEDKLVKTQSFTTLMGANVPPIQAYKYSGLDSDPEAAAIAFEAYQEEKAKELNGFPDLVRNAQVEGSISGGGQEETVNTRDTKENGQRGSEDYWRYRRRVDRDGDGIVNEH